jgi:hypothetical protein
MIDINKQLNEIHKNSNYVCTRCGRKYPDVLLNIEGHIHHGNPVECKDLIRCKRYCKKRKKK